MLSLTQQLFALYVLSFLSPNPILSLPIHTSGITASTSLATQLATPSPSTTSLSLSPQQTGFSFDLAQNLVSTSSNTSALPSTSLLPSSCFPYIQPGPSRECTSMTGFNVTFDDCSDPFTICHCDNANMSMDTVVDRFSRVPVGLRRYVGAVIVAPAEEARAYTLTSGDIHMFGDTDVDVWVHESMHAFDFTQGKDPLSSSQGWQDAIHNDSCVPDNYSTTNAVEDFAQVGVVKMYSLANQGVTPPGMLPECMYSQLHFMDQLSLFNVSTLFGNTCHIPHHDGSRASIHFTPPPILNTTSKMPIPLPYNDTAVLTPQKSVTGLMSTVSVPTATPSSKPATPNGANTSSPDAPIVALLAMVLAVVLS
ncbi:hypothetical protein VKT23_013350 [Stygiomarasmius scandens]|uniref:Conidiation-specific protein 13 n=1 Tax=Marasmiellus scandens TaxID=2682957 RepID=A0ABR1J8F0_9AGAR